MTVKMHIFEGENSVLQHFWIFSSLLPRFQPNIAPPSEQFFSPPSEQMFKKLQKIIFLNPQNTAVLARNFAFFRFMRIKSIIE